MVTSASRRRFRVARGYRRLLVPVDSSPESLRAFEIACRLAADDRARVTAVAVLEVPASLPLDAHMADAEDAARGLLERVGARGDAYGVKVAQKLVRARDAAAAIVVTADSARVELIVIGAHRTQLEASGRRVAPDIVLRVLNGAPCRVMVVSTTSREAA